MKHSISQAGPEHVVVGAGYAGVLGANRLARKSGQHVLLISEQATLLHRVRLHETAARGVDTTIPLAGLLHPRVQFLAARAVALDAHARTLTIDQDASTREVVYRTLVLALGSGLVAPFETRALHALTLSSHDRALALHAALCAAPAGAWINVVGGSLTAIELASELAEAHPGLHVRMVCDQLAPQLPEAANKALRRALLRLRVAVQEQFVVTALDDAGVHDEASAHLPAHFNVLATGFRAALPGWLGALPTTSDGRLAVDDALRVEGFSDVYAIGDLASPPARCIGNRGLRVRRDRAGAGRERASVPQDLVARAPKGASRAG